MIIGYARVSSSDQNLDRQIEMLEGYGCEHIIKEKKSGVLVRDEFEKLLMQLRFKDKLVVTELSRLSRNVFDFQRILIFLKEKEISLISIKEGIDTSSNSIYADFMLNIVAALADLERSLIKERQMEGIIQAKKRGVYKGKPRIYHENAVGSKKLIYDTIVEGLQNGESIMMLHRKTGVSRKTIYKIKNELFNTKTKHNM